MQSSGDGRTERDWFQKREGDLPEPQSQRADDNSDEKRVENSCAAMEWECGHTGSEPHEEGQGIDRKREDNSAEQANAKDAEDDSDGEHSGASVTRSGRTYQHHRAPTGNVDSTLSIGQSSPVLSTSFSEFS